MKKMQKSIAYTLIMIMLLGQIVAIYASGPQPLADTLPTEKIAMTVDYLGADPTGPGEKVEDLTILDLKENAIIWIGVALNPVSGLGESIKANGVKTMEIAFDYDPSIIVPYKGEDTAADETAWMALLKTHNINLADNMWHTSYEIHEGSTLKSKNVDSTGREEVKAADWEEAHVIIKKIDMTNNTNNRFQGTNENKAYLIKMPFKVVKDMKSLASSGLKLARGPSTLVLGAGTDGITKLQWHQDIGVYGASNLKNWVNFGGDINLTGGVSGPTNITVTGLTGEDTPDKAVAQLFKSVDDKGNPAEEIEKYDTNIKTYFVRLPADETKASIKITTTQEPTITYDDYNEATTEPPITLTIINGGYQVDIDMADVNMLLGTTTEGGVNGFNNTITIATGTDAVTINIQKLVQPRIDLAYGNSPYGEISKMNGIGPWEINKEGGWDTAKVEAAKTAFNKANKYGTGYVPTNAIMKNYTPEAWGGSVEPTVNMDRNDKAMFVYMRADFTDAGFTVWNSVGEEVVLNSTNTVERKIKVNLMATASLAGFTGVGERDKVYTTVLSGGASEDLVSELKTAIVRPGKYEIEYIYVDKNLGRVSIKRPLVVLSNIGNANMDAYITTVDGDLINNNGKNPLPNEATVGFKEEGSIFKYRVSDINADKFITTVDGDLVNNNGKNPLVEYYNKL